MNEKKQVKYFIGEFDRINEGLKNRELSADDVINISLLGDNEFEKGNLIVYYRE